MGVGTLTRAPVRAKVRPGQVLCARTPSRWRRGHGGSAASTHGGGSSPRRRGRQRPAPGFPCSRARTADARQGQDGFVAAERGEANGLCGGAKARRRCGSARAHPRRARASPWWPGRGCAHARTSGLPEPRRGRALGTAALGQGTAGCGVNGGAARRAPAGAHTWGMGLPRAPYRWLNGGQGSPELGFGQRGERRRSPGGPGGDVLGAAAIRCRRVIAVPCSAATVA